PWPESMRVSITKAKMADVPTKVYTGSPLKPGVTIKYGGRTLKKGTDYKLTWSSNTNPGMGKIKITGIGQFKGSKTVSFKIIPRPTRIKSVTALKKGFNVTWCKRTKQITGYSIKWSRSSGLTDLRGCSASLISSITIRAFISRRSRNVYGGFPAALISRDA
ncbi:MAG: hypothetical protein ACSW8A_10940, partial [Lachnospiraceae bacterium]